MKIKSNQIKSNQIKLSQIKSKAITTKINEKILKINENISKGSTTYLIYII